MFTVIAKLTVTDAGVQPVLDAIPALVAGSVAEPGCHCYEFNQAHDDPRVFYVYEKWADDAALDAHMQMPHFTDFVAAVGGHFAAPAELVRMTTVA